jgi:hypothetical protein
LHSYFFWRKASGYARPGKLFLIVQTGDLNGQSVSFLYIVHRRAVTEAAQRMTKQTKFAQMSLLWTKYSLLSRGLGRQNHDRQSGRSSGAAEDVSAMRQRQTSGIRVPFIAAVVRW